MQTEEAILLRIFVGEDDHIDGRATYKVLVEQALKYGMAGATVLPGPVGFGPSGHMRSELDVDAGPRAPMIVEIVDSEASVMRFLHAIDGVVKTGLVTMEKVLARHYGRTAAAPSAQPPGA